MNDPTALTLRAAAASIARGELRAEALVEACLDRIERLQPKLNCFIRVTADAAREQARAADRAVKAGQRLGPLHGVPLAHKDMFYRAGEVCSCGSKIRAGFVPDHTATVLARFDAAGAVELGRLNLAEFALGPTGHNDHFGRCRNPGIPSTSPAAPRPAPAPPSRPAWRLERSALTPAGRSGCRRPYAASPV